MIGDIEKIIKLVEENLIFDEQKYPELKGASERERLLFAVRHSTLHFAKRAGKIAAVSEDADHGGELDIEELKKNIPKAIVDALRLSRLVGMTWTDISDAIEKRYEK